jgi:hypothetical protein
VPETPGRTKLFAAVTMTQTNPANPAEAPVEGFPGHPTVFHVTHWKAGSQWVRTILHQAAGERYLAPKPGPWGPVGDRVVPGAVYTPVYAQLRQFRANIPHQDPSHRVFVVIRDPRDALVSWYYSLLYSHSTEGEPAVVEARATLGKMDKAEGMRLMIDRYLEAETTIHREWLSAKAKVFRYEDMWADQQGKFKEIFEVCGFTLPAWRRRSIVLRNSFIRHTWWRFGREEVKSHLRKGTPGDWRNHFDQDLKNYFKSRDDGTLVLAGYEKDDRW